jgi:hypothetical protein
VSALETDRLAGKLRPAKSKETSRALALVSDKREDFVRVARQRRVVRGGDHECAALKKQVCGAFGFA